ncbi:hypothetical protein [Sphingomonas sp. S-NIH.Pt15_0812]|uniref:hypothetical protein n=1 Tax=Sphingomonas sp. S-NIH.Pt15_0812 TaxID=1920129 RepID=UPI0019D292C1|nr:hypothetical protein [Sphingomonas sp. S-NIH.Pt15_0812]
MLTLRRLFLSLLLAIGLGQPAQAAITMTFWSHEFGNEFPHAFFALRGVPDAGGAPVDVNYGFTAKSLTPAILFGTVRGRLDLATPSYMRRSDVQFSLVLTDAQYAAVLALVREWGETGDTRYNLNRRNCVHFVQEAARRAGLSGTDQPALMKKPRSYLRAVAAANPGRVVVLNVDGRDWLDTLPALPGGSVAAR